MARQSKVRVLELLSELEAELQALGWWEAQAPSKLALQSQQPFCVDTLEFSQWLQWVFIPRMHSLAMSEDALPSQCAIYEMAEVVYHEQLAVVANLLRCLKHIDTTVVASHVLH